jgi:hypothetical protein
VHPPNAYPWLTRQVSELELLHLLSVQPGYKQMKLVRGPRQVSCFVEFEDTGSATAVHNAYQGAVLASSDRGGIRIQYSKNPFGKRSSIPGNSAAAAAAAAGGMPGGSNTANMLRGAVGLQVLLAGFCLLFLQLNRFGILVYRRAETCETHN